MLKGIRSPLLREATADDGATFATYAINEYILPPVSVLLEFWESVLILAVLSDTEK
jgi:hypothetical protein